MAARPGHTARAWVHRQHVRRGRLARGAGAADHVLHRLRSDRRQPARRPPGPDHGDGPPPAGRAPADRRRRRRHRHGRRSELRQDRPADPDARRDRAQHGRHARAVRAATSTSAPASAIMVNNADWLRPLHYLDFLRDIGRHFSVNQMLAAEAYKTRLESGLTFLEFNYMLLQAYDFLHLFQQTDCRLADRRQRPVGELPGRRRPDPQGRGQRAFVLATPLLTTASGAKMGKTEQRRRLARPRAHLALRLLPVLDQHRGRRRRPLPGAIHLPADGRGAGARRAGRGRCASSQGGAGVRGDHADAMASRRRARRRRRRRPRSAATATT